MFKIEKILHGVVESLYERTATINKAKADKTEALFMNETNEKKAEKLKKKHLKYADKAADAEIYRKYHRTLSEAEGTTGDINIKIDLTKDDE
jgi:hypothetical protein